MSADDGGIALDGDVARVVRGIADEITAQSRPPVVLDFSTGVVTDVTAGVVTVETLGVQQQMGYLDDPPVVGATVAIFYANGSPLIHGSIHGTESFYV